MMRVGIYTYFPPYIGGGERYIMTFANALQDEHDVSFLCSNPHEYQKLSKILNIDLSKVKFIEFHGQLNYKVCLYRNLFKRQELDYDIFVAMTNHINPPTIGLGRQNILHIQFPYPSSRNIFNLKRVIQQALNLSFYKLAVVNSNFTKSHVKKKFPGSVEVIYPPVETESLKVIPFEQKKNQIISVGRFIGTKDSKCQIEMIDCFRKMHDLYPNLDIEYLCVGGERPEAIHQEYLQKARQKAQGYPIKILTDVGISELANLYAESKFFWHGKGFSVENKHPEYTEHFGISTVEAMASGCIPIVYQAGGQLEIVEDGYNGFLWKTKDELMHKTIKALMDSDNITSVSHNAYTTSARFSSERFQMEVKNFIRATIQSKYP